MSHFVVDASIWVARLIPQDTHYEQVCTWMGDKHAAGDFFVSPALLLAEVAGAISHRTGDNHLANQAVRQISMLPGINLLEMEQRLAHIAATLAADLGLRGADSFYVATASILDIPLITLDIDQRMRVGNVVRVEMFP